ncbi:hypothetical protein GYMLUDRAFT_253480 [Collybiopsis luxurians FD-317 M1]|uniref:Uncharacterized protein n=1 Tax=Collybiopsis luxurians FD-317 M1 TaxID=944289 RepID=A0A0D0B735_9AGAR|nr:hypothetical protein GYMLUDRAFT_253480 [Collybiopsis luxurians FD-317 M1]
MDQIPDPTLQITFKDDITRLGRVWDDEADGDGVDARMRWDPADCGTLLSINGTPIALQYWCNIYKGKRDKRWKLLKSTWTEWKFIVERYRSSTPETFWDEFSDAKGDCLHWKAICSRLYQLRGNREQELVDQAKAEYGNEFTTLFVSRGKVLEKKSAIVCQYLALKNSTIEID